MTGRLDSFIDELQKIADQSAELRKREALQFAGMGATAGPIVGGLANLIMHGKPMPKDIPLHRWVPASMMTGAVYGGVIPILRHAIHRHNVRQMADRRQ